MNDEEFVQMFAGETQDTWEDMGFSEITDNQYNPMMILDVGKTKFTLYENARLMAQTNGVDSFFNDVSYKDVINHIEEAGA